MNRRKVIYIAGPIKGVERYWEGFERAEDELIALGFIPVSPSRHPVGLTAEQYARLNFATIDVADAVLFLPGWQKSKGARLERDYCIYTEKPFFTDPFLIKEVLG